MKITSPTEPEFNNSFGGNITITNNNDGTWTAWSDDSITSIRMDGYITNNLDITEIVVVSAKNLTSVSSAFSGCTSLVAPNASEQTQYFTSSGTNWVNPNSCP